MLQTGKNVSCMLSNRSLYIKTCVEPKVPMVEQLATGFKQHCVLEAIRKYPDLLRKLFLSNGGDITADMLLGLMKVTFSLNDGRKEQEISTYKAFCEFLELLDCHGM